MARWSVPYMKVYIIIISGENQDSIRLGLYLVTLMTTLLVEDKTSVLERIAFTRMNCWSQHYLTLKRSDVCGFVIPVHPHERWDTSKRDKPENKQMSDSSFCLLVLQYWYESVDTMRYVM